MAKATQEKKIHWFSDLDAAIGEAKAKDKHVMIDFFNPH